MPPTERLVAKQLKRRRVEKLTFVKSGVYKRIRKHIDSFSTMDFARNVLNCNTYATWPYNYTYASWSELTSFYAAYLPIHPLGLYHRIPETLQEDEVVKVCLEQHRSDMTYWEKDMLTSCVIGKVYMKLAGIPDTSVEDLIEDREDENMDIKGDVNNEVRKLIENVSTEDFVYEVDDSEELWPDILSFYAAFLPIHPLGLYHRIPDTIQEEEVFELLLKEHRNDMTDNERSLLKSEVISRAFRDFKGIVKAEDGNHSDDDEFNPPQKRRRMESDDSDDEMQVTKPNQLVDQKTNKDELLDAVSPAMQLVDQKTDKGEIQDATPVRQYVDHQYAWT